tara:strand:- start:1835 stop:2272 length:438 start_codon:yes stop_codon:yes gene_type:complete
MSMIPSFFSGGADRSAEKIEIKGLVANESISIGHVVRTIEGGVSGVLAKAVNTTNHVIGIATSASEAGGTIELAQSGLTEVLMDSTPSSSDNGKTVFLGSNGLATLSVPTTSGRYVIKLGFLTGADGSSNPVEIVTRILTVVRLG